MRQVRHTIVNGHCLRDAASLDCFVPRNDGGWGRSHGVSVTCRRVKLRFANGVTQP